jgi:hypothetical protein
MSEHARRAGMNEAIFREVNEQIQKLTERFDNDGERMTVVCECADGGCTIQFEVPVELYERVREDARLFLVAPGHEIPELEEVVHAQPEYEIVRKREGTPADVAEETDPRS